MASSTKRSLLMPVVVVCLMLILRNINIQNPHVKDGSTNESNRSATVITGAFSLRRRGGFGFDNVSLEDEHVLPRRRRRGFLLLNNNSAEILLSRVRSDNPRNLSTADSVVDSIATADNDHPTKDREIEPVEVSYTQLYDTIVFIAVVYALGSMIEMLGVPSLVGEIIAGFLLGPPLANFVPFPEALVLFGEIGLIMLVLEAGIDIDVGLLHISGTRALCMAIVGSTIPIFIGFFFAYFVYGLGADESIVCGVCFGPTSVGVAMGALTTGKVVNTPIGQLIIATCVIDDIIGLILLSELEAIVDPNAMNFIIPILSAFCFLVVLGWSSLTWLPKFIENKYLPLFSEPYQEEAGFGLMTLMLLVYLPMLFYSKASYLMGAFLTGLTFSQIHSIHTAFVHRAEVAMAWLLRIFFSASIGFQVPIKQFFKKPQVALRGLGFFLAVASKAILGLFVPSRNEKLPEDYPFSPVMRDRLVVGIAMTNRAEMNFIIATFALDEYLFDEDTYSSIVFAILLSCFLSPFVLLRVIEHYNKLALGYLSDTIVPLVGGKTDEKTIPLYLAVQTYTNPSWGLQELISRTLFNLRLTIIDHRNWAPRHMDTHVVTEVFVQDNSIKISPAQLIDGEFKFVSETDKAVVDERCEIVRQHLTSSIGQPTALINVSLWCPDAITTVGKSKKEKDDFFQLTEKERAGIISEEAKGALDKSELIDTKLDLDPTTSLHQRPTRVKTLSIPSKDETNKADEVSIEEVQPLPIPSSSGLPSGLRQRRQRITSMPVISDDLWQAEPSLQAIPSSRTTGTQILPPVSPRLRSQGITAGKRNRQRTVSNLQLLMKIEEESAPTVHEQLAGFIRSDLVDESK